MSNTPTQTLQSRLGYHFAFPDLLCQALTHRSAGPANYERLEHLGDAVLDLAVTAWLYRDFPYFGPGQMSILRAELVCAETLARLARQLDLPHGPAPEPTRRCTWLPSTRRDPERRLRGRRRRYLRRFGRPGCCASSPSPADQALGYRRDRPRS